MAEGSSSWNGLGQPLYGEYEQKQQSSAVDMVTLTATSTSGGDFLVAQNSAGTERFVVEDGGNIVMVQGAAADNAISVTQYAAASGYPLVVYNSSASRVFNLSSTGALSMMVATTLAVSACASNASATYAVSGFATTDFIWWNIITGQATGLGSMVILPTAATNVTVYAAGGSCPAQTINVIRFAAVAAA
jgi:hypothetical protein